MIRINMYQYLEKSFRITKKPSGFLAATRVAVRPGLLCLQAKRRDLFTGGLDRRDHPGGAKWQIFTSFDSKNGLVNGGSKSLRMAIS